MHGEWIDGNQCNMLSVPFLWGIWEPQKTCYHYNNCGVRARRKISGWEKYYKAGFNSQKAGYRSTTGRQSAEANMTGRQEAGSQKSKELAGFKITNTGRRRYRKQGSKRQSKNDGDYWAGYCVRLMRKRGGRIHKQVEDYWKKGRTQRGQPVGRVD